MNPPPVTRTSNGAEDTPVLTTSMVPTTPFSVKVYDGLANDTVTSTGEGGTNACAVLHKYIFAWMQKKRSVYKVFV